jgi:hypothetical protein
LIMSAPVALTVILPVEPDKVMPLPAVRLNTPVLFTAKLTVGPVEVNPVTLMPAPAVGVTVVITRLLLSNNLAAEMSPKLTVLPAMLTSPAILLV